MFCNSMPKTTAKKRKPCFGEELDVLTKRLHVSIPLDLEGGRDLHAAQDTRESKSPGSDPGYLSGEAASGGYGEEDMRSEKYLDTQQQLEGYLFQLEILETIPNSPWKETLRGINHWPRAYGDVSTVKHSPESPGKEIPHGLPPNTFRRGKMLSDEKSVRNDIQINSVTIIRSPSREGEINRLGKTSYVPQKRKVLSKPEVESHNKHKPNKTSNGTLQSKNGLEVVEISDDGRDKKPHELGYKNGNCFQLAKEPNESLGKGYSTVSVIKFNQVAAHTHRNAQHHGNSHEEHETSEYHSTSSKGPLNRPKSSSADSIKDQEKMEKKSWLDYQLSTQHAVGTCFINSKQIFTDDPLSGGQAHRKRVNATMLTDLVEEGMPSNSPSRHKWANTDKLEFHNEVSKSI